MTLWKPGRRFTWSSEKGALLDDVERGSLLDETKVILTTWAGRSSYFREGTRPDQSRPYCASLAGGRESKLEDLSDEERDRKKIDRDSLALHITHVGKFNKRGVARKSGFREGDILVEVDGLTERMTESQYFGELLQRHPGPATLEAVVLRNGKRVELKFAMQ